MTLPGFGAAVGFVGRPRVFPSVAATETTNITSSSAKAVALPAGIASGDRLVVVAMAANASGTPPTVNTPSGWESLADATFSQDTSASAALRVLTKVADGGEGSSVSSVGTSDSTRFAAVALRITSSEDVGISSEASGTSGAPNPASLSPAWGAAKTLWLAIGASFNSITSAPTNYSDYVEVDQGGPLRANVAVATRQLEASSDDPGSFSGSSSAGWRAYTVAIEPA